MPQIKFFIVATFLFSLLGWAQTGTLSGTMLDGDFNDVLPFATVAVKGGTEGASSDFDGKYTLQLAPGTYTMVYSFVGYGTKEITDVVIKANQTTVLDVTLNSAADALEDVIITVTRRQNSEKAVLDVQKNATVVLDGISSEAIKKQGASDVASAVKAVPGVSVQGGKYVYVRGLGDRYTKTLLNGMEVPGLDPDKNTLQLDIFPTNTLENLQVVKSATAEYSADFTGGIIDIITKDIPSSKQVSISAGLGYNPDMHFNDDYLTYEGGDSDFLGFDDGTRDSPLAQGADVPLVQQDGQRVRDITQSFNRTMATMREQSFMNVSLGASYGNNFKFDESDLGLTASLSYKNETQYFEEFVSGQIIRKSSDNSELTPQVDRTQIGDLGTNNVILNGLLGLTYKSGRSKYRFNAIHIQNGEQQAGLYNQRNQDNSVNEVVRDVLVYTQRSLTNILLGGDHSNENGDWRTEWKVSPTLSIVDDKDFRETPFRVDSGTPTIEPSETGDPNRLFRELSEYNIPAKIDFTKRHKLLDRDAKLRFGGGFTYKTRDFAVDEYALILIDFPRDQFDGDPDQILAPENIYDPATDSGVAIRSDFNISNTFESSVTIGSAYVSEEFQISERFKSIVGLRFEKFDLFYTGQTQEGDDFDQERFIDKADFFPSVNLIYDLNEDADFKLRGSYARTTARPSFKEASAAQIVDPILGQTFIGNPDIEPAYINNFDLRLEKYTESSDFFAISGFYKTFKDPIEITFFQSATDQFTPQNLGDATVLGAEIEVRKTLDFIGLRNFNFQTNVSVIESQQDIVPQELLFRNNTARDGEEVDDTRELQGQSPYLINTGITYQTEDSGWRSGLFYNVQGRTLQVVASSDVPDVFTLPFHSLNFTLNKTWGLDSDTQHSINLKVDNLLGDERESEFDFFGTTNPTFFFQDPGTEISISYGLTF
jgi:outer membrane receptor for ferrienterochelin and colicin